MNQEILDQLTIIAKTVTLVSTHNTISPWVIVIITPFAILISAGIGYYTSQRTIKKRLEEEDKNKDKKISLIKDLLKDETAQRWESLIYPCLKDIISVEGIEKLNKFNSVGIYENDLFIIKNLSHSFLENHYIGDSEFISKIIHANVLFTDLIWLQNKVVLLLKKIKNYRVYLSTSNETGISEKVENKFKEEIYFSCDRYDFLVNELNFRIKSILQLEPK